MFSDSDAQGEWTCASKPIAGAMCPFSQSLIAGCERFAALAQTRSDPSATVEFNAACVLFAAASIEARLNEWISMAREWDLCPPPVPFWEEMVSLQKTLSLESKWNLIASVNGGKPWASGVEPFNLTKQS